MTEKKRSALSLLEQICMYIYCPSGTDNDRFLWDLESFLSGIFIQRERTGHTHTHTPCTMKARGEICSHTKHRKQFVSLSFFFPFFFLSLSLFSSFFEWKMENSKSARSRRHCIAFILNAGDTNLFCVTKYSGGKKSEQAIIPQFEFEMVWKISPELSIVYVRCTYNTYLLT